MELSEQKKKALTESDDLLVIGGPGSGKTTLGLLKAQRRIAQGLGSHQCVLFLSFSHSAVHQIAQAAKLHLSADSRRLLSIQTFHSFCWDILRSHGSILGIPLPVAVLAPEEEAARRAGMRPQDWSRERSRLAKEDGRVAFDLFASLVDTLFTKAEVLRSIYASCHPLVIVDEFQDTDDAQWNVVAHISRDSQLVALADRHQRIYDFRPGVRADRLERFAQLRKHAVCDLEGENHRSGGSDIAVFAQHVMDPTKGSYTSAAVKVDYYSFSNQCGVRIKFAIKAMEERVRKLAKKQAVSVLVLGSTNRTVRNLSEWLRHQTPKANFSLSHELTADSDEIANAWHVLMSFLDSSTASLEEHAVEVINRLIDFFRCQNTQGDLETANRLRAWQQEIRMGKWPAKSPFPRCLKELLGNLRAQALTGESVQDLSSVVTAIEDVKNKHLDDVANCYRLSVPFRTGDSISSTLNRLFRDKGSYWGASSLFQRALAHHRLTDRYVPSRGREVMTMHKCKGREYDAVVIFDGDRDPHRVALRGDTVPHERSRRLLRVAITRARFQVFILTPKDAPCQLLP